MHQNLNRTHFLVISSLIVMVCLVLFLLGAVIYRYVQNREQAAQAIVAEPTVVSIATVPPALETAVSPTLLPPIDAKPLSDGPSITGVATPVVGIQAASATAVPTLAPTPFPTLAVNPPDSIDQRPLPLRARSDLLRFFTASYPTHNYFEAVSRLTELELGPRTVVKSTPFFQVGDRHTFFVQEGTVEAVLLAATAHAYFWVEEGLGIEQQDVLVAAERFEKEFYPPTSRLFGQPWLPGVDNDPRFSILHLNDVSNSDELGYFTDLDEYPRTLYSDSNEQEIVYLNMSQLTINSDIYFGTLVHEVQHLIQWSADANEMTWLNEGLSQLAELYVGLDTVAVDAYLQESSVSLNRWSYDEPEIDAHYANAYLFVVYIWEQLGETAVQELVRHPENGFISLQAILANYSSRSWQQFIADWSVALYLDDIAAGVSYGFQMLDLERPLTIAQVNQPSYETIQTLDPFGIHYIDLNYEGFTTITFVGDNVVDLMDAPPPSGEQVWFAPDMNEVDAQLTAVFDLQNLEQATLTFDAWYDLEEDWDFAYLSVSTDDGISWEILEPVHRVEGTYGPAFNGRSADAPDANDGWISETILLDDYIGHQVLIRFELLTDSTGISRGFGVDNIAIPELGYQTNVDDDTGIWEAVGFVKTGWQLPQQWRVQIIEHGTTPQIVPLPLNHFNQGQWSVSLDSDGGTLVVMPLTPFIETPARYWLKVE